MMKACNLMAIILALSVAGGCDMPPDGFTSRSAADEAFVRTHQDEGIKNAVIAQHTLFPYHFVPHGAGLNELGKQDLAILVEHFRGGAGRLNVRRGDEGVQLYQQRVQAVVDAIKATDLRAESVVISDGLPGGEGMASERVVLILEQQDRERGGTSAARQSTSSAP